MKFTSIVLPFSAVVVASAASIPLSRRDVDPSLVPSLGFSAGVNPTGTGDCDGAVNGANGQPVKVPCACPPDSAAFLQAVNQNVAAGQVVNNPSVPFSFPTDNSKASQLARINAASVTLQNLHGPGQGCPIASTTLQSQAAAVNAQPGKRAWAFYDVMDLMERDADAWSEMNMAKRQTAASPEQVAQLAPNLGFGSGVNPTGTGDCDGAVNGANGQPVKVPCACPPAQADFVTHLQADVAAGHAVNNPSVATPFPTDDSPASQLARVNTALVSLQNLNGPGKGCPAVSTTLQAQQKALQAQV